MKGMRAMTRYENQLSFRDAKANDLPAIIALLSDDPIGATRDGDRFMPAYERALEAIEAQAGNSIIVAELNETVVGVLQLTLIPGLSRGGMLRAQIEGVRVSTQHRGHGIGQQLFKYAIDQACRAGCGLVQLTSDKQRPDALKFYEALGFKASHEGFKLSL